MSLVASPSASVTVLGDAVAQGGVIALSGTGERVLDIVAAAGGLTKPIHESSLRLTGVSFETGRSLAALFLRAIRADAP